MRAAACTLLAVADFVSKPEMGKGWAVGSIDGMGEGPGFRKVRQELGVEELGINAIVLAPGAPGRRHSHEQQEEVYFCHSGQLQLEFGDGSVRVLGPGGFARVDAPTVRMISNPGETETVAVVIGAKGGYVGRDGVVADS